MITHRTTHIYIFTDSLNSTKNIHTHTYTHIYTQHKIEDGVLLSHAHKAQPHSDRPPPTHTHKFIQFLTDTHTPTHTYMVAYIDTCISLKICNVIMYCVSRAH